MKRSIQKYFTLTTYWFVFSPALPIVLVFIYSDFVQEGWHVLLIWDLKVFKCYTTSHLKSIYTYNYETAWALSLRNHRPLWHVHFVQRNCERIAICQKNRKRTKNVYLQDSVKDKVTEWLELVAITKLQLILGASYNWLDTRPSSVFSDVLSVIGGNAKH